MPSMIRIAITAEAFEAITTTPPLGSIGFEFSMVKAFVPRYRYDQLG
jgi:NADH:ubiquinone oxidoreductase subunit H